jgi:hypothetical protein
VEHEIDWRDEYIAARAAGVKPLPSKWRHTEIRKALETETAARCAYCDADITAVSFGDVEHFKPRNHFPELVVEWNNLTLACQTCNNEKSDKWDDALPYVNPYEDEISEHIVFVGGFIHAVSYRGVRTVTDIGLGSLEKTEARWNQVNAAMRLFNLWKMAPTSVRSLLEEQIQLFLADTPYIGAVEAALRGAGYPLTAAAA